MVKLEWLRTIALRLLSGSMKGWSWRNPSGLPCLIIHVSDSSLRRRIYLQSQKVNNGLMDIHHITLANSRRALWERIIRWRSRSPDGFNEDDEGDEEDEQAVPDGNPEDQLLLLPSSLDAEQQLPELVEIEMELRKGQANESLKALRNQLAQRLVIHREMGRNLRGQHNLTRAQGTLSRINTQITELARGYRNARTAMQRLGMVENDQSYPPLLNSDISTTNAFDNPRPLGRGEATPISWIWRINVNAEINGVAPPIGEDWLEEGMRLVIG